MTPPTDNSSLFADWKYSKNRSLEIYESEKPFFCAIQIDYAILFKTPSHTFILELNLIQDQKETKVVTSAKSLFL